MKKILVVDNHPMVLRLLANQFEKLGHTVHTATNGLNALEVLKTFVPDIIFIDLVMPNISGEKLCRIIRNTESLKNVNLVILSAIAAEEQIDVRRFGADACITKGSFDTIAKHLGQVLKQAEAPDRDAPRPVLGLEDVHHRAITKELLSSKHHYEVILDNMSEGIVEFTPKRQIIYVNPAAAALTGQPEEKLLAADVVDLFPPPVGARILQVLDQIGDAPAAMLDDKQPVMLGGWQVSVDFYPVADNGNHTTIGLFRDVTERRQAEAEIRQQHSFLERIFESIQHPYFLVDVTDFTIVHANGTAQRELGIKPGISKCRAWRNCWNGAGRMRCSASPSICRN